MQRVYNNLFENIASVESLFLAWEEFSKGKRKRSDVQAFSDHLEENLFSLHSDFINNTYYHGSYTPFTICDPKQRQIHKATVRDRIVHHAIFSILNPIFEPTFIAHSFSCRVGKGTHRAVDALEGMLRKTSKNRRKNCYVLKCDIYEFFASVDHKILLHILSKRINDPRVHVLLREVLESFRMETRKGIPIGNLTSQLFANVYMHEFDQFVKHILKVKHYIRYTDDFIFVSEDKKYLHSLLPSVALFLQNRLGLRLHPHKVTIRKFRQGVDFLGYVLLPHHRILRTKTRRRMIRRLQKASLEYRVGHIPRESLEQSLQSYLDVLSHADTYRLAQDLQNQYFLEIESLFCVPKPLF